MPLAEDLAAIGARQVSMTELTGAAAELADTFTMSLTYGWDQIPPEQGGRPIIAGDLVALVVATQPETAVECPPGWTANGSAFWKLHVPGDPDPVFRSAEPCLWWCQGWAVTSCEVDPGTAWTATPTPEEV